MSRPCELDYLGMKCSFQVFMINHIVFVQSTAAKYSKGSLLGKRGSIFDTRPTMTQVKEYNNPSVDQSISPKIFTL